MHPEFNDIQKDAYLRCVTLCNKGEKSAFKIILKMKRWGLSDKEIEAPLARLRTEGFIDDVRYTQSFVNDKFTFNKWGRIKIAFMLRQEKIPEAVVNAALEEIDEAVYFTALLSLIREKRKTVRAGNARELHDKLYRYAQGRGFESELINVALKMLL